MLPSSGGRERRGKGGRERREGEEGEGREEGREKRKRRRVEETGGWRRRVEWGGRGEGGAGEEGDREWSVILPSLIPRRCPASVARKSGRGWFIM